MQTPCQPCGKAYAAFYGRKQNLVPRNMAVFGAKCPIVNGAGETTPATPNEEPGHFAASKRTRDKSIDPFGYTTGRHFGLQKTRASQKKDIDRFLAGFDDYKKQRNLG